MRDEATSGPRIATLHPKIRNEVKTLIEKAEELFPSTVAVRVVQAFRTPAQQDALYAQGRTKPGKIVTNAKAWKSNHNYGTSFDFAMMYDKDGNGSYEILSWNTGEDFDGDGQSDWLEVVKVFKSNGYSWGGDWKFKDYPHLEKTFDNSVSQLYQKVLNKDFIPGTQYVNL